MADHTHIEWTDATWNPITGCSVVSPGCINCYAMRLAGTLPAISLWQPWASLLFVEGGKVHETRDWDVPRRIFGRTVLVHAAKHPITRTTVEDDDPLAILCTHRFGPDWRKALPFGAFVGTARISGSLRMPRATPASPVDEIAGNWEPGRYAWRMDDRTPLAAPIPTKGQQGWWMAEVEL